MNQDKNRLNQKSYRARQRSQLHVLHTYIDSGPYLALCTLAKHSGSTKRDIIEQLLIEAADRLPSKDMPEPLAVKVEGSEAWFTTATAPQLTAHFNTTKEANNALKACPNYQGSKAKSCSTDIGRLLQKTYTRISTATFAGGRK